MSKQLFYNALKTTESFFFDILCIWKTSGRAFLLPKSLPSSQYIIKKFGIQFLQPSNDEKNYEWQADIFHKIFTSDQLNIDVQRNISMAFITV